MPCLNQNNAKFKMKSFRKLSCLIICFYSVAICFFTNALKTFASSDFSQNNNKIEFKRSLESLQDLDYRTWQIVVYSNPDYSDRLILRIVGYPGNLRMDHLTNLKISSGRKNWDLEDITLKNKKFSKDFIEGAAEFEITDLISDLSKNRPLRLSLPGVFPDLPIPPYLVAEWRSLIELNNE